MTDTPQLVLVTGGAGFIGSHTVDRLMNRGLRVRVLDNFDPQVHRGPDQDTPRFLTGHIGDPRFSWVKGDIRNRGLMREAIDGVDVVLHLAAAVGVAQSMYRPQYFTDVNVHGTGVLLDVLANESHSVKKLVLASSMTLYGEGAYRNARGEIVSVGRRSESRLAAGDFDVYDADGHTLEVAPTPEDHPLDPTSIYALTKRTQEDMVRMFCDTYGIAPVVLRYFNCYGPRQSLSNPYTGVAAIFISRFLAGRRPVVFEDGNQQRDFVHVGDVAQANVLAVLRDEAEGRTYNVGSGAAISVREMVATIAKALDKEHLAPDVQNKYRPGDTRNCIADISRIQAELGYAPQTRFEDAVTELIEWAKEEKADRPDVDPVTELSDRKLIR